MEQSSAGIDQHDLRMAWRGVQEFEAMHLRRLLQLFLRERGGNSNGQTYNTSHA